jgi:HSP20 family protein
MTLVKYSSPVTSASPVDRLASELFGSNITRLFGSDGFAEHSPRVNIMETPDDFRIAMQVPGFDRKDLKVDLVNDTLTIRGELTEEEDEQNVRWTRREFGRMSFERSFTVPATVKTDAIKAEVVNGVLQLTIPKSEEAKPRTRTISVQ